MAILLGYKSMTNTDTNDTKASVAQCIRIAGGGCRLCASYRTGWREAENLANIKRDLRKAGFTTPLIADIHFNPAAAETAARIVEKVRINPGKLCRQKGLVYHFPPLPIPNMRPNWKGDTPAGSPLINICREYGTAVRIGVNHGSLSDRIMTRYGNTRSEWLSRQWSSSGFSTLRTSASWSFQ
ncbi:MAG: flavodoxin-dependent (E)-4-hydroxy-3-methylbut-2-enyl-diphosphate synthase [Marinilabiliales bacterium]|nr:flavodoxin-dependent (E)-4-hydroxy-3-methylbut-2-enyl-diphosphate synthase [Marinilabiliales bacterium]